MTAISYVRLEGDLLNSPSKVFKEVRPLYEKRWTLPEKKIDDVSGLLENLKQRMQQIDEKRSCLVKAIIRLWRGCFGIPLYEETLHLQSKFAEVKEMHDFVKARKDRWICRAREQKRSLYLFRHVSNLERTVHFTPTGRVFVHLNRTKQGDRLVGSGVYKQVKLAVEWGTGNIFVSASPRRDTDVSSLYDEESFYRAFAGIEGFAQLIDTVSYVKNGRRKCRHILPYYEEGPLYKALRDATPADRKNIFEKLIRYVATMHRMGYLHRDLKPENICVWKREGRKDPVIVDFGTACKVEDEKERAEACTSILYVSPEYAIAVLSGSGNQVMEASSPLLDSWSLACVLCKVLSVNMLPWEKAYCRAKREGLKEEIRNEKALKTSAFLEEEWIEEPEEKNSPQHLIWQMFAKRLSALEAEKLLPELKWDPKYVS